MERHERRVKGDGGREEEKSEEQGHIERGRERERVRVEEEEEREKDGMSARSVRSERGFNYSAITTRLATGRPLRSP